MLTIRNLSLRGGLLVPALRGQVQTSSYLDIGGVAHDPIQINPMGDMNDWRNCKDSPVLDEEFGLRHDLGWLASLPAGQPMLSLDRIYTWNGSVVDMGRHDSPAARKTSDDLPVLAEVGMERAAGETSP